MSGSRAAWWRLPLVHFLVLGGLLYAATRLMPDSAEEPQAVVITAPQILQVRQAWKRQRGRWPGPEEERALVEQLVADELLYQEARRQGLGRDDLVVRRRLIDKMAFLSSDPARSRDDLYREAVELGLDRDDPIVRRRLIQKLRLLADAADGPVRATEQELSDYYERHAERFTGPARRRLSHVFLSRDRHRAALGEAAQGLLRELRERALSPPDAVALGDPFLLGHHLPPRTTSQLGRDFGEAFAARLTELPAGAWSGPVESAYGLHLVWVHEVVAPRPAELAAVRRKVLEGLRSERQERRLAELLDALRQRYPIRVEEVG